MRNRNARIAKLLRRQRRLLVHFNTPMSRHALGYPHDLQDAIANPHWAMCCSTVKVNDQPPSQHTDPGRAPVQGHIGVVMGLKGSRVVEARPWDQGSNGRGDGPDRVASLAECRTALADKSVADEWFARDLKPLAIFKFPTAYGYTPMAGEIDVPLPTVLADFPTMPIVSVWKGRFQVFDRTKGLFFPAAYADLPKA